MDQKRSIGVRIRHQRLETLQDICTSVLKNFLPVDGHEFQLRQYIRDLEHKLWNIAKNPEEVYMLSLSDDEAMAYNQLWQLQGIKDNTYTKIIVGTMLTRISAIAA